MMTGYTNRVQNNRIDGSLFYLPGIRPSPDHDCMDMRNPILLINFVNYPAKPGSITGNHSHKLPANCILKVTGRVKREPRYLMFFTTLPDCLNPELLIEWFIC